MVRPMTKRPMMNQSRPVKSDTTNPPLGDVVPF
jgi:hypothetical protein